MCHSSGGNQAALNWLMMCSGQYTSHLWQTHWPSHIWGVCIICNQYRSFHWQYQLLHIFGCTADDLSRVYNFVFMFLLNILCLIGDIKTLSFHKYIQIVFQSLWAISFQCLIGSPDLRGLSTCCFCIIVLKCTVIPVSALFKELYYSCKKDTELEIKNSVWLCLKTSHVIRF